MLKFAPNYIGGWLAELIKTYANLNEAELAADRC